MSTAVRCVASGGFGFGALFRFPHSPRRRWRVVPPRHRARWGGGAHRARDETAVATLLCMSSREPAPPWPEAANVVPHLGDSEAGGGAGGEAAGGGGSGGGGRAHGERAQGREGAEEAHGARVNDARRGVQPLVGVNAADDDVVCCFWLLLSPVVHVLVIRHSALDRLIGHVIEIWFDD